MVIGGVLVVLSLPILAPLIVGTVVTWVIHGLYVLTRELRSDEHRSD